MEGNVNQMNYKLSPMHVDQVLLIQVSKEIVTLLPKLLCSSQKCVTVLLNAWHSLTETLPMLLRV